MKFGSLSPRRRLLHSSGERLHLAARIDKPYAITIVLDARIGGMAAMDMVWHSLWALDEYTETKLTYLLADNTGEKKAWEQHFTHVHVYNKKYFMYG